MSSPPVFDGMIAVDVRLFVATMVGNVVGLAGECLEDEKKIRADLRRSFGKGRSPRKRLQSSDHFSEGV
jgi:hypothetical protein